MRAHEMINLSSISKFHLGVVKKFDNEISWKCFLNKDFSDNSNKFKGVVPSSLYKEYSFKDRYKKAYSLSAFCKFLIENPCSPCQSITAQKLLTFDSSLKIVRFHVNGREIEFLSKEIDCLVNLKEFYAYNNFITCLPKEIENLTHLVTLNLDYNLIRNFPKEITSLVKLEFLSMSHNDLDSIPKDIGNLINLYELHLDNNSIKVIPKEIGKLKNLRHLYLNDNFITVNKIPKKVKKLTLQTLCLGKNRSNVDVLLKAFNM